MGEIYEDDGAVPPLRAMFDGARHFGLTDAEVLETVDRCLYEVGADASVGELVDELTGALAQSIVAKQRRVLTGGQETAPDERPARSKDPR
jgi:hypothetical protein